MPKFLSKLVKKVPPFRYIHSRLDELGEETDQLMREMNTANIGLQSLEDKLTEKNEEITFKIQENQKDFVKDLNKVSEEQENLSDIIKKCLEKQDELTKLCTEQKKQLDLLQKKNKDLNDRLSSIRWSLSKDIEYFYFRSLQPEQYEESLKDWFFEKTGTTLNLEHPQTYNEKIQWLKLNDSTELKKRLSDKYAVREWVTEKIGDKYLVPLLGVYDCFDDIDFDQLPEQFVIKTNHACGTNRIVTDRSKFNKAEAKTFFDTWMRRDFAFWNGLELQYKGIEPKILIEEYMENSKNNLNEYKVFCFDGSAYYIRFQTERSTGLKAAFYDRNWQLMPFIYNGHKPDQLIEKPINLNEMLAVAEELSKGFSHVRVDLYCLESGEIKFSEMTFTPSSGISKWEPCS